MYWVELTHLTWQVLSDKSISSAGKNNLAVSGTGVGGGKSQLFPRTIFFSYFWLKICPGAQLNLLIVYCAQFFHPQLEIWEHKHILICGCCLQCRNHTRHGRAQEIIDIDWEDVRAMPKQKLYTLYGLQSNQSTFLTLLRTLDFLLATIVLLLYGRTLLVECAKNEYTFSQVIVHITQSKATARNDRSLINYLLLFSRMLFLPFSHWGIRSSQRLKMVNKIQWCTCKPIKRIVFPKIDAMHL